MPEIDDIAVVGYSFKLPNDVENDLGFWEVLENRRNLMTDWPASRINLDSFVHNERSTLGGRGGHFITEDVSAFDAPFFSVTTKEAASMDPMQRWTLEVSYRAFETAGISAERLKGSQTAVFSASMLEDYGKMIAMDPDNIERSAATGSAVACIIPNRISWYFDLRGPSMHVNTACSSSLSALDMACKTLHSGDANCAIVTGSNLLLDPAAFQMLSSQGFLSRDSLCYSFDHRANGYARGEGIVAVVLKPVSTAIRDGDMIRAVIRASASNQDGHTPVLTQPSLQSQEELIRHVYKQANLPLDQTRTGTPVGDPIEMKAIGRAFHRWRSAEDPLYVGSVKANIGHLEGASGLASLVKCILILEKGVIPPNALLEKLNPAIDVDLYHTMVPTESRQWPCPGLRRVSLNSFGFGGSNSHIILDDAHNYLRDRGLVGNHCTLAGDDSGLSNGAATTNGHTNGTSTNGTHANGTNVNGTHTNGISNGVSHGVHVDKASDANGTHTNGVSNDVYAHKASHVNGTTTNGKTVNGTYTNGTTHQKSSTKLFVWSAADEKAIQRTIKAYNKFYQETISGHPDRLSRLSVTLSERRGHMLWRGFAVSQGEETLPPVKAARSSTETGLAFVFTGQGAQYVDMGWDLTAYPVFAETLREINALYRNMGCEWSLFDELRRHENIDKPEYSQPLSTAIQIALVELWKSFGVIPKAVVGHSSGEIAAAYAIGALSLESACKVSYLRGRLAGKLRAQSLTSPGAMISINVAEGQVSEYLEKLESAEAKMSVCVACVNSPLNCTLSGPEQVIDAVKAQADADGIFAQKLKTGVAYHSPAMQAIADEYRSLMGCLKGKSNPGKPIPMISSVSGHAVDTSILASSQYWVDNLVSPVRFVDAVQGVARPQATDDFGVEVIHDLVEIGPHPALRRPVEDSLQESENKNVRYTYSLHRSQPAIKSTLELAGRLFCLGYPVHIAAANQQEDPSSPFLTDCPSYPFDRSQYWTEPRISRDFRFRPPVRGETLGVCALDWNPLEPRWRNFLSVESVPWIGQHKISDTILYPGAGMLVMALEAVLQMVPADRSVSGYLVKQADFISPIIVPESWDERVETQVRLQRIKKSGNQNHDANEYDVALFLYSQGHWSECFRATIQIDDQESPEGLGNQYQRAADSCTYPVDCRALYRDAANNGLQWGEWFQLLQDVHWNGDKTAVARVDMASQYETTSIVHPAILDQALQVLRVAAGQIPSANIPVRMSNAWFASSGWQNTATIRWWATADPAIGDSGERGSVYALADDGTVLCSIQSAVTAAVSGKTGKESEQDEKHLLYSIEWKPQLSLLEPEQLVAMYGESTFVDETSIVNNHVKLCTALDNVSARTLSHLNREKLPAALHRHVEWMERHVGKRVSAEQRERAIAMSEAEIEAQLCEVEDVLPSWAIYTTCARKLPQILAGEIDPLQVVFESDQARVFYSQLFHSLCADGRLGGLLDLASHENSGLRILEVGAGTGGMTGHMIAALQEREARTGAPSFASYTYTDISPAFFEQARLRWVDLQEEGRLNFSTLNLDRSVESQGYAPESYDLIVAASVLHATPDLEATIRNVRTALKPGGRLVLLEAVSPDNIATNFMAGLVPGWWVARESWRGHSAAVSETLWDWCLSSNGFSGNELVLRDYESPECHNMSVIITTAVAPEQAPTPKPRVVLVIEDSSQEQQQLVDTMSQYLYRRGWQSTVCGFQLDQLQRANWNPDDIVICLAEVHNRPLMAALSEEEFSCLKQLTSHPKLLWATATNTDDSHYPEYSAVQGFVRCIRAEQVDSQIITVAIEGKSDASRCTQWITKALEGVFLSSSPEVDFIVRDGLLTTGRAVKDLTGHQALQSVLQDNSRTAEETNRQSPGDGDALNSRDVEINAHTWGFDDTVRDLLEVGDCAGIVTRVGSSCDTIKPGDRVCMMTSGLVRSKPCAQEQCVIKIPETMSLETATALLIPGMTAYHALVEVARIHEGDRVLVHSASSSMSQLAIQIAKLHGAQIFATAQPEQKSYVVDTLGLPEDQVFVSNTPSFSSGVLQATQGEGVDIIFNSLTGDSLLRASLECIAPGGRFLEVSRANAQADTMLPLTALGRNVSFSGIDLETLRPNITARVAEKVLRLFSEGKIRHAPSHHFTDSSAALQKLQQEATTGRIILTKPEATHQWMFEENASYLIAGGSGGLGRAILRWMAHRGAKNLIILSRSGASSKPATAILAELRARGVNVIAPACDVSSRTNLASVLDECARTMPPIKGCINAAMVLRDAIFQDGMSFEKWDLTMQSKVQTSWNLHHQLPRDLHFFIMLSSLLGVTGQPASSNYGAGCSFQDALARYRIACGERALSLDLGWMRNVGIIAETAAYQRQRQSTNDMQPIDDTDLLALLDLCCDPSNKFASSTAPQQAQGQIVFGLKTPVDILRTGQQPPPILERPLFAAFSYIPGASQNNGGNSNQAAAATVVDPATLFREATDPRERARIVIRALAVKLSRAMSISPDDVESSKPLSSYGVDSLMVVELRNWIIREFAASVAVFDIMGDVSIAKIADIVVARSTVQVEESS